MRLSGWNHGSYTWGGMFNFTPLITIQQSHEGAVSEVTTRFQSKGFRVIRSFDLQSACAYSADSANKICPHHHEDICDCQLVVLLVYSDGEKPVTLIAHSNDGLTQMGLGLFPDEELDPTLEARVIAVLTEPQKRSKIPSHATKH